MNHWIVLSCLLVSLFSSPSRALATTDGLYQVTEPHPEEVRKILPFIQNYRQEGRLWLVSLKSPKTPSWVFHFLRIYDPKKMLHYTPQLKTLPTHLPTIDPAYLAMIKTTHLQNTVGKLASYKNRAAGTPENQSAQKWIASELQAMGYEVTQDCYSPNTCSVIAEKKGSNTTGGVILVEGHFDSVGKDYAGADDNASGTASTIEIARILKNYPNQNTLRFFLTNGEEIGLLGATHYSKVLAQSGHIKDLKLVINMDMVGYNSNGIVELETNAEYDSLAKWFAALTEKYTSLKSKITLGAWGSDHVPFLDLHVPTLLTIEDWSTKSRCYHLECDKAETMNFTYATEITRLNAAAVLTEDASP